MSNDQLAPSVSPPPRTFEPWTYVPGHNVIARPRHRAQCSCGERAVDGVHADSWRIAHLREAWPVLIPRLEGETYARWMERVSSEHVAASKVELDEFEANGGTRGIAPGELIPVISRAYGDASNRVLVLQHQPDEILPRAMRERGLDD